MFSSSLEGRWKARGSYWYVSSPVQRSDSAQGGWLGGDQEGDANKNPQGKKKKNLKINPFFLLLFFLVCLVK